jgi:hypothetical protein
MTISEYQASKSMFRDKGTYVKQRNTWVFCELIHLFSSQLMHGIPYDGQSHNCLHKLSATCFGYGTSPSAIRSLFRFCGPKSLSTHQSSPSSAVREQHSVSRSYWKWKTHVVKSQGGSWPIETGTFTALPKATTDMFWWGLLQAFDRFFTKRRFRLLFAAKNG